MHLLREPENRSKDGSNSIVNQILIRALCLKTSLDQVIEIVVSQDQKVNHASLWLYFGKKFQVGFMTEAVIAMVSLLNKVGFKEIKATYVSLLLRKVMEKAVYVETNPHAIQRKGYCGDKIIYSKQNPSHRVIYLRILLKDYNSK